MLYGPRSGSDQIDNYLGSVVRGGLGLLAQKPGDWKRNQATTHHYRHSTGNCPSVTGVFSSWPFGPKEKYYGYV